MIGKDVEAQNRRPLSELAVSTFFSLCITVFAIWVIATQIALLIGMSLLNLCRVFSFIMLLVLPILSIKHFNEFRRSRITLQDKELHTVIILFVLALIGIIISVIAIRPDPDDVDYTSSAIYFLKHYNEPLDLEYHDYGLLQFIMGSRLRIFLTMEFFCAYLAFIFHVPFLHIYHFFLPALGGMMIPLAWFLVCSKFSKRTIVAALAATAVCVFLSIDGDPHRSFGNFAFVRIWQGKAILMSVVVPLFTAFSLDFFRSATFLHWKRLFLLLVASAGLTYMAAFFMPFMGVVLGLSCWYVQGIRNKSSLKKLFTFFLSYSYLLLVTLYCFVSLDRTTSEIFSLGWWPRSFVGQFKLVFVNFWSYPSVMMVLFSVLSIGLLRKRDRTFLITWIVLCIVLFLNPGVFPFIAQNATTFNAYWRLFYLLPFPLVIGLPMVFLDRINRLKLRCIHLIFWGLILVAIIGNLWPHQYATFGKLPLILGQYKIDLQLEFEVKKIISVSVPGPMLAPYQYSAIIPRYSPDFPQVAVRKIILEAFSIREGKAEETKTNFRAIDYITGISKEGLEDVNSLIKAGLVNIVVASEVKKREDWPFFTSFLVETGFKCVEENSRFFVYVKN